MVRGILSATQGMLLESEKVDIYTNNLANASTNGFKRDEVGIGSYSFSEELMRINDQENSGKNPPKVGPLSTDCLNYNLKTSFALGNMDNSGCPTDFYIEGDGFFTIEGKNTELYTRNGNFNINNKGELVTDDGYRVLGEKGPVIISSNKSFSVDREGNIRVDGKIIDRLSVKKFSDPQTLKKLGSSLYLATEAPEDSDAAIIQGTIEGSNVNTVQEMVTLLQAQKTYESNEKTIKAQLEALEEAVSSVGRVG